MNRFLATFAGLALVASPLIASATPAPAASPSTTVKTDKPHKNVKPASQKNKGPRTTKKAAPKP